MDFGFGKLCLNLVQVRVEQVRAVEPGSLAR